MTVSPHNLRLTIDSGGDASTCRASLHLTLPGQDSVELASESVDLKPFLSTAQTRISPLKRHFDYTTSEEDTQAIGKMLASIALPKKLATALIAEINRIGTHPIRLWIRVKLAQLADLPWELLYLDGSFDGITNRPVGHLALHPHVHFLREADGKSKPTSSDTETRILIAHANPGTPSSAYLAYVKDEITSIRAAVGEKSCYVVERADVSPAGLQKAIEEVKPHIFHFIGHGKSSASGGSLVLQSERYGVEALLQGHDLSNWLVQANTRLVFLAACDMGSPMRGMASELVENGVAAVVAMQMPIRDSTSVQIARVFYGSLLEPCPLETALGNARHFVRGHGPEWAALTLTLSPGNVVALHLKDRRKAKRPQPINLPIRKNPHFIGRQDLMPDIHRALETIPVAIFGTTGLGKTQLAAEYAHAHLEDYPGGVFWLNASDQRLLKEEYAAIGRRSFNVKDDLQTDTAVANTLDHLQSTMEPILLILDGLKQEGDLILPVAGNCRVLVTTRLSHLFQQGFHTIKPPLLTMDESLALLQTHVTAKGEVEIGAAKEIARKLDCLPYALALVAQYVKLHGLRFSEYSKELKAVMGKRELANILDAIQLSCVSLTPPARTLLTAAACLAPDSIAQDVLFEVSGLPSRQSCRDSILLLERHSLLNRDSDNRLTMHGLVHLYVRKKSPLHRLQKMTALAGKVLTTRFVTANAEMNWRDIRAELPHCHAVLESPYSENLKPTISSLSFEMGVYYYHDRAFHSAVHYLMQSKNSLDESVGFEGNIIRLYQVMAESKQHTLDHDGAVLDAREALSVAESTSGISSETLADCHHTIGYVFAVQGHQCYEKDRNAANLLYRKALESYHRSLELYDAAFETRHHPLVAVCLNDIGSVLEQLEEFDGALQHLNEALNIGLAQSSMRAAEIAPRYNNIGRVYRKKGDWSKAVEFHSLALPLHEETYGMEHIHVGMTHFYLAIALRALNYTGEETKHLAAAAPILRRYYGSENVYRRQLENRLLELEHTDAS